MSPSNTLQRSPGTSNGFKPERIDWQVVSFWTRRRAMRAACDFLVEVEPDRPSLWTGVLVVDGALASTPVRTGFDNLNSSPSRCRYECAADKASMLAQAPTAYAGHGRWRQCKSTLSTRTMKAMRSTLSFTTTARRCRESAECGRQAE